MASGETEEVVDFASVFSSKYIPPPPKGGPETSGDDGGEEEEDTSIPPWRRKRGKKALPARGFPLFEIVVGGTLPPLSKVHMAGVSDSGVQCAGEMDDIASRSPGVVDLDVSGNALKSLDELAQIVSAFPRLHHLNVSRNSSLGPSIPSKSVDVEEDESGKSKPRPCCGLTHLGAANIGLASWSAASHLLSFFNASSRLQDVSLSDNPLHNLPTPISLPPTLRILRLDNANITSWDTTVLLSLSPTLPTLEELSLARNPITTISYPAPSATSKEGSEGGGEEGGGGGGEDGCGDDERSSVLGCLVRLNLSETLIDDWESLLAIGKIPKLRELRFRETALVHRLRKEGEDDAGVRLLVLAQLPNVTRDGKGLQTVGSETTGKYDGSPVTRRDRLDAEAYWARWKDGEIARTRSQVADARIAPDDADTAGAVASAREETAIHRSLYARLA